MLPFCPSPPDWHLPWSEIEAAHSWIRDLEACPQDPIYHAEGNVLIHTRMVCEAMIASQSWRELPSDLRDLTFWSALLHDIAKPATTQTEPDGRVTARGHSRIGANMARPILWQMGMPFQQREWLVNMIRYHQVPFWLIERERPERLLREVSLLTRCDLLAILAEGDLRGRICEDTEKILEHIELFVEMAKENACLDRPAAFVDGYTRYRYFLDRWDLPDQPAYGEFKSKVTLMCGLPGSGKDHWIKANGGDLPMISLDAIRRVRGIAPGKNQGAVIQEAREQAKVYLREGRDFIWNATNISQQIRQKTLGLFTQYNAYTRVVYLEVPHQRLMVQNKDRDHVVPEKVMQTMIRRWTVPDPFEAHEVVYLSG